MALAAEGRPGPYSYSSGLDPSSRMTASRSRTNWVARRRTSWRCRRRRREEAGGGDVRREQGTRRAQGRPGCLLASSDGLDKMRSNLPATWALCPCLRN